MVTLKEMEDDVEPFSGAWETVVANLEYRHAATQTDLPLSGIKEPRFHCGLCKATQTVRTVHKATVTFRTKVTDVSYVPDLRDTFLTVKNSDWKRGCEGKDVDDEVKVMDTGAHRDRLATFELLQAKRNSRAHSIAAQRSASRTAPTALPSEFSVISGEPDFEMLRCLLARWRSLEEERSSRDLFEESRAARRYLLLCHEVKMLRGIDALKRKERRSGVVARKDDMGRLICMDGIPQTPRQRQLYRSLTADRVSTFARRDTLAVLEREAREHSCSLSRELSCLIDQELRLLLCDVAARALRQLRKRLRLAYLRLMENVVGNRDSPCQGNSTGKWPPKFSDGSIATKLCKSCNRLRDLDQFPADSVHRRRAICNSCIHLGSPCAMREPYERMLRDLKRSEREKGGRGLISVVTPKLVHHLVNNVWHGRSGFSECDDLDRLRLVRLDCQADWSPWNTLLLTEEEAVLHEISANPLDVYDSSLVQKFRHRNLRARLYFGSITKLPKQRSETSETGRQKLR